MEIITAHTKDHYRWVRDLFLQYADSLGLDLEFQGFSRELAALPGAYASPSGCILLAVNRGDLIGCVALRPLEDKICEMKRLYVVSAYRGRQVGRILVSLIIEKAREIGYEKMRLDTIGSMREAIGLYRAFNFRTIEPYCFNPLENVSYMELCL